MHTSKASRLGRRHLSAILYKSKEGAEWADTSFGPLGDERDNDPRELGG